jgi:Glycoside-hydrolase family GH114
LAKLIADHAHSRDLAIAQKNLAELGSVGKNTAGFDFAIAEECQFQEECQDYIDAYGDLVLEIEYTDNEDADAVFATACADHGAEIAVIYRDRELVPAGQPDYHYDDC